MGRGVNLNYLNILAHYSNVNKMCQDKTEHQITPFEVRISRNSHLKRNLAVMIWINPCVCVQHLNYIATYLVYIFPYDSLMMTAEHVQP